MTVMASLSSNREPEMSAGDANQLAHLIATEIVSQQQEAAESQSSEKVPLWRTLPTPTL